MARSAVLGLAATAATFLLASQRSHVGTDFVLAAPNSRGSLVVGAGRPVVELSRGSAFVADPATAGVGAGRLAGAAAALAALALGAAHTKLYAKVRGTWKEKQRRNAEYLSRHPPPLMKKRALTFKIMYARLNRREDEEFCEWASWIDPREPEYQWSVEKVRTMMENPENVPMERTRAAIGIPMPPIRLTETALKQMRGGSGGGTQAKRNEDVGGNLPGRGDEAPKGNVDLSSVELDFIKFKGFEVSKKVLARLEATQAKNRKK